MIEQQKVIFSLLHEQKVAWVRFTYLQVLVSPPFLPSVPSGDWGSLNRRLPQVSYIKAIDIFFMTSFIFIFLTLLEYTLVLNGKFRMYKINSSKELRRKKQIRKRFGEVTTPRGIVVCSQVLFIRRKHFRCQRQKRAPREKCPYLELFWSAFSRIRTDYLARIHSDWVFSPNGGKCGPEWLRIQAAFTQWREQS